MLVDPFVVARSFVASRLTRSLHIARRFLCVFCVPFKCSGRTLVPFPCGAFLFIGTRKVSIAGCAPINIGMYCGSGSSSLKSIANQGGRADAHGMLNSLGPLRKIRRLQEKCHTETHYIVHVQCSAVARESAECGACIAI